MQPAIITIPGYKVNEYLLVVRPHEELSGKIMSIKEEFAKEYKMDTSSLRKPSLTLVRFTQYEMLEEKIITRLNNVAMAQYPFKIELKDFGSFPAHTIFVNVTSKVPFQGLVKSIRQDVQRLMKLNPENKPHFIIDPYITIAGKLKPWQYEKGWLEYSHKHFTGRFIADEMLLLRRTAGDTTQKYLVAGRFRFQNLPVSIRQGELFG